jgi:hypothetical protein
MEISRFVSHDGVDLLISDKVPLSEAPSYGDCLIYFHGHYEVWEEWEHFPTFERSHRGLPSIITERQYEEFPRGRVVFDKRSNVLDYLYGSKAFS